MNPPTIWMDGITTDYDYSSSTSASTSHLLIKSVPVWYSTFLLFYFNDVTTLATPMIEEQRS